MLRPATLLKRDSNTGEIFKNTYFEEHMRTAASNKNDDGNNNNNLLGKPFNPTTGEDFLNHCET